MDDLLTALQAGAGASLVTVTGLRGSAAALLVARAAHRCRRPVLCVAPSERDAAILEQDLALFTDLPVFLYPGYDIPPYTPLSPDPATVASRLAALYRIRTDAPPFILIAPCEALLRRVLPREKLTGLVELVISGEESDQQALIRHLTAAGYEHVSLVQTAGDFSVRGGIVDLFAPGYDYPIRLDFFGDTVESIRLFDPISQRSVDELDEAVLLPTSDVLLPAADGPAAGALAERFQSLAEESRWGAEESERIAEKIASSRRFPGIEFFLPLFYDGLATAFDYLPPDTQVFLHDPAAISRAIDLARERIEANFHEALEERYPALPPDSLFLAADELAGAIADRQRIELRDFAEPDAAAVFALPCGNHTLIQQDIELQRKRSGMLAPLAATINGWLEQGDRVLFACRSLRHARHLAELLEPYHDPVTVLEPPIRNEDLDRPGILLYGQPLANGFDLTEEGLHILSESELFGEIRIGRRRKGKKKPPGPALRFDELQQGDFVVHRAHGIGVYEGLITMDLHGVTNDFLQISYQGNDKLYVPIDRLNAVSKYQGLADREPKIDKLGGKAWANATRKVKEAVWKVAQDLLDLYARRQLQKGVAFSPPDELYRELEESFPYDETPGQRKAIDEVLADLETELCMDRLVCGDVGFGKTEVAVRAAFKVMLDNFQVAMLVPTTVLAEQHAETFRERLAGFPVRIECLNRFRKTAEQKKIISDLAAGKIDMVIGTHRLLSKDVVFKRLGLLIVDEEHRFGVTHKERLKRMRSQVDVLTLTATPIPRTLQMSLLSIRDLSVIATPPEHRRSVKTFVARYDDLVVKEAVSRELARRGQVFLIHNRVQSIHEMARTVQRLVPEARVAVAHGQMPGKALEDIMVRFVRRQVDVLVCTTIVESGLDIPNANTIIITRADRLGLAEIYQLRGRVGRSSEQAYAYLLVPSLDGLSKDAQQRLRALMDYNELGGGFKLAMSDLQIRGGGNILGESQSGTIAAVGYDLYLDLLQRTVEDLKRRAAGGETILAEEEVEPEVTLRISAYIPPRYVASTDQRYICYRKITSAEGPVELEDLRDELRDRYGPIPEETENLLSLVALKAELRKLKISKLEQGPSNLVFTFVEQTPVTPEQILAFIAASAGRARLTPDNKLVVSGTLDSAAAVLTAAKKVLRALQENAT